MDEKIRNRCLEPGFCNRVWEGCGTTTQRGGDKGLCAKGFVMPHSLACLDRRATGDPIVGFG